jgi:hypothetical protein
MLLSPTPLKCEKIQDNIFTQIICQKQNDAFLFSFLSYRQYFILGQLFKVSGHLSTKIPWLSLLVNYD